MAYSQCNDYSSNECYSNDNCTWVESIEYGYCENHNSATSCPISPACSWSCQGGWYLGQCVGSYACTGGYYQQDNSYCEEVEVIECSNLTHGPCLNDEGCEWVGDQDGYCQDLIVSECDDINEFNCNNNSSCNWVSNIEYGNCINLPVSIMLPSLLYPKSNSCCGVKSIDTLYTFG